MRTLSFQVGLLAAAAALAALPGCGGKQKELPKVVSAGDDKTDTPGVAVPPKSEPEAVAVVERAIKAMTDGHPERVEKAKVNRAVMKGFVIRPTGPNTSAAVDSVRRIEGVWADRFAFTDEAKGEGAAKVMMRLRRPVLWIANQRDGKTVPVDFGDNKAFEAAFAADAVGRHWMALLVPLVDSKTVVFDAKKQVVNGQTYDAIRASVPACPLFTLWFDEKTGHLIRVDFAHLEPNRTAPTRKTFALGQHKAFGSVVAPGTLEYWENGNKVEEWTIDAWEFPDKLEDSEFDPPK